MGLTTTGMVIASLGSKLSEQSGALGHFGHAFEIVGSSVSMAGVALTTFNSIAKNSKALQTAFGGHLGVIIAVVAFAVTAISNLISKYKELKKAAQ
jgi:L-serine deaminase